MNSKNISKHLARKMTNWIDSVANKSVANAISENAIITGGSLTWLRLTGSNAWVHNVTGFNACKATWRIICKTMKKLALFLSRNS